MTALWLEAISVHQGLIIKNGRFFTLIKVFGFGGRADRGRKASKVSGEIQCGIKHNACICTIKSYTHTHTHTHRYRRRDTEIQRQTDRDGETQRQTDRDRPQRGGSVRAQKRVT